MSQTFSKRMVEACRADPGSRGLVTALGWYATQHSVGVYSTDPPASGFVAVDPAGATAGCENGILRIVLPLAPAPPMRRVEITIRSL